MTPEVARDEPFGQALERGAAALRAAGVEDPRRDARLLLAAAADVSVEQVFGYPERLLDAAAGVRFADFLRRRAAREPVSRVLGTREFWGLDFALSPATLDPRPDSETLVAAVAERLAGVAGPVSILDLGTGSGCLLLALLTELPLAWGLGVDIAPEAVATARDNARRLGLADRACFAVGDWLGPIAGPPIAGTWKAIVSNPPYIREDAVSGLAPEVRLHEPRAALTGGPDGLQAYRALAPALTGRLARAGLVAFEVGAGQAPAVAGLLRKAGFEGIETRRDLAGVERCVLAKSGPNEPILVDTGGKKVVGKPGVPD